MVESGGYRGTDLIWGKVQATLEMNCSGQGKVGKFESLQRQRRREGSFNESLSEREVIFDGVIGSYRQTVDDSNLMAIISEMQRKIDLFRG